jgi:hypothetical protein
MAKTSKLLKNIGYLGNFGSRNLDLGDVLYWDDKEWNFLESLSDDIDFKKYIRQGHSVDLKFQSNSAVDVKIGAQGAMGVAQGKMQLKFTKKKSAFVSLQDASSQLLGFGEFAVQLRQIWKSKKYSRNRHAFVSEVISAPSGTIILSMERNNVIELGAKSKDSGIQNISDVASGNVSIDSKKSQSFEIISDSPFEPLFRATKVQGNKFDWVK